MHKQLRVLSAWIVWGILVSAAGSAMADIPPGPREAPRAPRKSEPVRSAVEIRMDDPVANDPSVYARVVIPRHMLEKLLENPSQGSILGVSSTPNNGGPTSVGTVVAGVLLALALAAIPVVWMRRAAASRASSKLASKAAIGLLVVVFAVSGLSLARADLLPFGPRPTPPLENGVKYILLEVEERGVAEVVLTVKP